MRIGMSRWRLRVIAFYDVGHLFQFRFKDKRADGFAVPCRRYKQNSPPMCSGGCLDHRQSLEKVLALLLSRLVLSRLVLSGLLVRLLSLLATLATLTALLTTLAALVLVLITHFALL
jgi:hypothetical protein